MAKNNFIIPYHMKTKPEIKKSIDLILIQLEQHGRSIVGDGISSRIFSRHTNDYVKSGKLYFTWNKKNKKSVIVVPPGMKLIRVKNKIKIIDAQNKYL